nr:integrase, catalytic region, zinc finger, CCHC-type, peptidase aspartic, catalytic [Tanacetum cinerariifolium]
MVLYIKSKEHGKKLYNPFINGPFKYGTLVVPRTPTTPASVRDETYEDLTEPEKIREACDIRATNIVLQGLPHDIYNMANHHTEAKEIWDRVKLLIKGSELSLQERESKLYDEFDTFTLEKGEKIHSYYLRQLSKMVELRCRRFRGDRLRGIQALVQVVMLQEIPTPAIFQTNDLDAFDSNCDEAPLASVVLMAKLSAYNSDVLSEVPRPDTYQNDNVIDQSVEEMQYSEQPSFINDSVINITNDSNVISYDQYLQETKNEVVQDTNCSTQQDEMIMSVIEEMSNQVAKCNENPLYLTYAQRKVHTLYCGHKIVKKHNALYVMDNEETLTLAEESRLKMYDKQNDQIAKDRKVNIALIDYAALNNLSKHFVPQKQLFAKQAFWLPISKPISKSPPVQSEPVLKEIPHELPTITAIFDYLSMEKSYLDEYNECVNLKAELSKKNEMVEKVIQIVLWYLNSGCSKHKTKQRSQLINFLSKFIDTIRFGNDHVAPIMGYGDDHIGNFTISRVDYVEGL